MQSPFSAKDWANYVPAWVIAFGFLVYLGVWAAKQLGLIKPETKDSKQSDDHREASSGSLPRQYWKEQFDMIKAEIEETKHAVSELSKVMDDFMSRRDPQWESLDKNIQAIRDRLHSIANSLLLLSSKTDNIQEKVDNLLRRRMH